jgi:hypothetical protein
MTADDGHRLSEAEVQLKAHAQRFPSVPGTFRFNVQGGLFTGSSGLTRVSGDRHDRLVSGSNRNGQIADPGTREPGPIHGSV